MIMGPILGVEQRADNWPPSFKTRVCERQQGHPPRLTPEMPMLQLVLNPRGLGLEGVCN
jgi:hypothetical protein